MGILGRGQTGQKRSQAAGRIRLIDVGRKTDDKPPGKQRHRGADPGGQRQRRAHLARESSSGEYQRDDQE